MNLTARVVRMVSGSAHAIVYMPRSVRRNARRRTFQVSTYRHHQRRDYLLWTKGH